MLHWNSFWAPSAPPPTSSVREPLPQAWGLDTLWTLHARQWALLMQAQQTWWRLGWSAAANAMPSSARAVEAPAAASPQAQVGVRPVDSSLSDDVDAPRQTMARTSASRAVSSRAASPRTTASKVAKRRR